MVTLRKFDSSRGPFVVMTVDDGPGGSDSEAVEGELVSLTESVVSVSLLGLLVDVLSAFVSVLVASIRLAVVDIAEALIEVDSEVGSSCLPSKFKCCAATN
jgi:hypothetical protein